MTRDTTGPLDPGHTPRHTHHDVDTDLLAGLWETAPFARLPWDAPSELKDLVEDIENPKRVYAIHRASRRHGFQQLVEKFIAQLREGCGSNYCTTPSCFSFRKRSVGRVPIRRYNVTSVRVLAVYMASQDNPEIALCPALRAPKLPPAAIDSLVFYRKPGLHHADERMRSSAKVRRHNRAPESSAKSRPVRVSAKVHLRTGSSDADNDRDKPTQSSGVNETPGPKSPRFDVTERHTGKDYRSFAANMFGTVAFKMLEWLTPNALGDMHETACDLQKDHPCAGRDPSPPMPRRRPPSPASKSRRQSISPSLAAEAEVNESFVAQDSKPLDKSTSGKVDGRCKKDDVVSNGHPPHADQQAGTVRRNSNARVRTNSSTQPRRQMSLDTYSAEAMGEESVTGLRSPRMSGIQVDKATRSIKSTTPSLTRSVPSVSAAEYFDESRSDNETSPRPHAAKMKPAEDRENAPPQIGRPVSPDAEPQRTPSEASTSDLSADVPDYNNEMTYDTFLPQTISALNIDVVDFICDVLQEDGTREQSLLEPNEVPKSLADCSKRRTRLRRRSKARQTYSHSLKLEWKLFIEQSIFYTLSDPHVLIHSFTKKGELLDSQTLWYCLLRMTRVAPSLVYHCLWLSAAHLFAPPKSVQSLRSPTARLFPKQNLSLTNSEAGCVVSICLHALIAALPVVSEKSQITDMSRLRSQGLSLAASGGQCVELCLQYDDAFSHDLAMRLARRLLAAITTRRYFDDMLEQEAAFGEDTSTGPDVLAALFGQLDDLSISNEETVHETRMSTLLLDWARAVMFQEWDGSPEVPGDGSFGGALALVDAIRKCFTSMLYPESTVY